MRFRSSAEMGGKWKKDRGAEAKKTPRPTRCAKWIIFSDVSAFRIQKCALCCAKPPPRPVYANHFRPPPTCMIWNFERYKNIFFNTQGIYIYRKITKNITQNLWCDTTLTCLTIFSYSTAILTKSFMK